MAEPVIKIKRSSVPGKIPTTASLPLGELALNTNDGKVYIHQDSVGIGSTVIVVNPWSVGLGSNTYNTFFTVGSVGIGTTNPTSKLTVVGVVSATSFSGSGAGLTSIPAGQLTGSLPAIDGSALTGIIAGGSGVIIRDDGSPVGTATTIDFGANLSVSFTSGIATITGSGGAISGTDIVGTALSISGISTFTNGPVLIGTATSTGTASQRLQVTGGAYVSDNLGVGVTAPAFKADIAGDARITSTNKMRFGGTAGTTNFYIQFNSTTNSLDFVAG